MRRIKTVEERNKKLDKIVNFFKLYVLKILDKN